MGIIIILFLLLLFMGVPIAYVLGCVAITGILTLQNIPLITVVQRMFSGLNSFTLLAVPLFIFAANIMNRGSISERLIDFAVSLVGHIRGGLGHANVLVSMLFAGISGSSQADTAGIGKILIPGMIKEGFSRETAVGVTAASSTIGVIIPPSIPMVIYSSVASASIGALFLGGLVPGILIGIGQMAIVYFVSKKHNYPKHERVSFRKILKLTLVNLPALITPVIIIGGVITGMATATESAAVACAYAIILGMFVFKTVTLKDLGELVVDTMRMTAVSLFALATANALGQLLSYYNINGIVAEFFANQIPYKPMFVLVTIAFFLFIGTFMDAIPAMILFVPVLLPSAASFGITPVQLGLIIVITLAIGQVTPPYGLCLMIAGRIANMPLHKAFVAVIPYIAISIIVVILIGFFPDIAFAIPKLIRPDWF
jgi:tripartite ATP-independent transporter DctM subunit